MNARRAQHTRRGSVIVPIMASLIVLFGMAALVIDIGRLQVARTELQASADAATLAGTGTLLNEGRLKDAAALNQLLAAARVSAASYAERNYVMGQGPLVDLNGSNSPDGDIVIGYLSNPTDAACVFDFSDPFKFNAVQVLVRRDAERNGSIALTFARVLGYESSDVRARATAAFQDGIVGYNVSQTHHNAWLLPFALKDTVWASLLQSGANDQYSYDAAAGEVHNSPDGIPELNLYPGAGGGQLPPGNFGTVDIGAPGNSTADISRQIRYGVNEEDLSYFGGELRLGPDGTLLLNGDTGLSAAVKDDLQAIRGAPRAIPLFQSVSGPGNNAYFTVNGFAGIRILNVKLTGPPSGKQVIVQPAVVVDGTAVAESGGNSYYVYRPVMLCR